MRQTSCCCSVFESYFDSALLLHPQKTFFCFLLSFCCFLLRGDAAANVGPIKTSQFEEKGEKIQILLQQCHVVIIGILPKTIKGQ